MPELKGVNIKEVWDYRLSTAVPTIYNSGKTWSVMINAKDNGDLLAVYDTKIPCEHGDAYDHKKVKGCYEWLLTVHDMYSRDNIEELKPIVAKINALNAELAATAAV